MESGLDGNGGIFRDFKVFFEFEVDFSLFVESFVHINFSDLDMIRATLTNEATYEFGYKMIWQQEFVMDNVFVKGKELLMIAGIVSGKEVKVEKVVMDGDVEHKANAAHDWIGLSKSKGMMGWLEGWWVLLGSIGEVVEEGEGMVVCSNIIIYLSVV